MRELTTDFGEGAGRVWTALNRKGLLKKEKLLEITQLKEKEFYNAVGWLAKENKISQEGKDCYKLDNTNLTSEIGADAGKVWQVMNMWGEVDVSTIQKLTEIDEKHVCSALGWLAREDKIYADEKLEKYNLK